MTRTKIDSDMMYDNNYSEIRLLIPMQTVRALLYFYLSFTFKEMLVCLTSLSVIAFFAAQTAINDHKGTNIGCWEPWFWEYSSAYCYGLILPVIIFYCKKWPLDKQNRLRSTFNLIVLYIPFTLFFITLMIAVRHLGYLLVDGHLWESGDMLTRYVYEFPKTMPHYVAIVLGTYAKIYFDTYQKEHIHAAKLNEKLLLAQIGVLKNQLQPHFLFNTLNLISSTMYHDVDKADSIIMRLGNLLRYSLETEERPWVSFDEELQAMMSYLEIAKLRFGDRLSTSIDVDEGVMQVIIPAMLLQPLLENSVKHGIEPSSEPGEIHLKAALNDEKLSITITNPFFNGREPRPSFSIGLTNTRERLKLLYGDAASISLDLTTRDAVCLSLSLPAQYRKDSIE